MNKKSQLVIGGSRIEVSNLDKVFYPRTGFTKGQMLDYYVKISPWLLPHLKDRPITLKRYPNGVEGLFFYEKECPAYRSQWVKTTPVARSGGGSIHYCVINNLKALVWAANLADLELHTFLHKAPAVARPLFAAFDLDPGPPAGIIACCEVALRLKNIFDAFGLQAFPKTSGSKGLQVFVPLNASATYTRSGAFARALAELLEKQTPGAVVSKMAKNLRAGKVLVDWSQNHDHKTTIAPYSLRAREHPTVSAPVTWREVEKAVKDQNPKLLSFEAEDMLQRVQKLGDLFAPALKLRQKLPPPASLSAKVGVMSP